MPLFTQPNSGTIGVDVSDHVLRAVYAVPWRKGLAIKRFAQVPLQPGIVVDGAILDPAEAAKAVHSLLGHRLPFHSKALVVGLPELHSFVGSTQQQRDSLEEEVLRHIPFAEEEVTIDSIHYDRNVIGFAAVKTDIAQTYWNVFSSLGTHVRALEVESQALARLYIPQAIAGQSTILADIGQNHSTFLVVQDDHIDLTHTSKLISGNMLTSSIMRRLNLDGPTAERVKIDQPTHPEVQEAFREHVVSIGQELERVINFHYSHPSDPQPTSYRLLVTGGGAQIPDLVQRLEQSVGMPVYRAAIPQNIHLPRALLHNSHSFATAIGLAARSIEK